MLKPNVEAVAFQFKSSPRYSLVTTKYSLMMKSVGGLTGLRDKPQGVFGGSGSSALKAFDCACQSCRSAVLGRGSGVGRIPATLAASSRHLDVLVRSFVGFGLCELRLFRA